VLHYIGKHTRRCQLREQNQRRSIVFNDIKSIKQAYAVFTEINQYSI
jgi:transcription-repair coupling factor (superfamily II helicase)